MKESPAKLFRKAPTLLHLFNHQNEDPVATTMAEVTIGPTI